MTTGGGYGGHAYGGGPFGGAVLPLTATAANFDIFCFQGVDMFNMLSEPSVNTFGNGASFNPNAVTNDQEVCGGDAFPTDDARIVVTQNVPDSFTIEWIVNFENLPNDFTNLVNWHIYLGTYDAAGPVVGFFVSKVGWAYTGAVSFPGGNLQLDNTFQQIPGSSAYSFEGEYVVVRAAVSLSLGVVYFYVTRLSELPITGQVLRAILPVIPASSSANPPVDSSLISVRGTPTQQACAFFDSWCLGSALIIPNLAPVANAGFDQAVRTCSIIQLDGSASFDPEGVDLMYQWRLIDAPFGSEFAFEGADGGTFPLAIPTGFTDKFHSTEAGVQDALDPFDVGSAGDVLLDGGTAYTIVGKGTDGNGFFLQIGTEILPDSLSGRAFKVLRQRGISNADTVDPTFFPDEPGFYSFDLTVFDGALLSNPSAVIVNVLESPLPRGCTPDLAFIFNYLSDFWNLVEGRDRISVFWGALAQVVATELFTLWQFEYSKSLRDIQRTFNRRWLHYDLLLGEPIPELTRIRPLFGGITSVFLFEDAGLAGVNNTVLAISSPLFDDVVSFTIKALNPATASVLAVEIQDRLQQFGDSRFTATVIEDRTSLEATGQIVAVVPGSYADGQTFTLSDGLNTSVVFEIDTVPDGVSPGNVVVDISAAVTADDVATIMEAAINGAGLNLTLVRTTDTIDITHDFAGEAGNVAITTTGGIPGTFTGMSGGVGGERVVIDAPFPFTIDTTNTLPIFAVGDESRPPSGTAGAGVGARTYKVDRSLLGLDVREDDFLVLEGVAYRISSVLDSAADAFPFQRVVVKESLPVAPSGEWTITGWVRSEFLDFYNGLVSQGDYADFTVFTQSDAVASTFAQNELVETTVLGVNETETSRVSVDQWPIGAYAADSSLRTLLARILRRTYVPVSDEVLDVPTLQRLIRVEDDEETLRRNLDFFIHEVRNGKGIRFVAGNTSDPGDVWEGERPPDRLWAEYTFFDNSQLIEDNFGLAVELTVDQLEDLPETVDYLSAVRGLWYAFFNGPTLRNLRIGAQILLGLPFAEVEGVIEEIRTDFSPKNGRMLVRDVDNEEIVRVYRWPKVLDLEVNPATGERYAVGDTVEEFAPLVEGAEVVDYINDPDWFEGLLNQGIFYEVEKFHKFLVRVDTAAFSLSSLLFVRNFILKIKPTYTFPVFLVTLDEASDEVSVTDDVELEGTLLLYDSPCEGFLGMSWMYDQPRAAGGGWRNQFDSDIDPDNPAPTFPTPDASVGWAYDKTINCPGDEVTAVCCVTFAAPATIMFDACFAFDTPIQEQFAYEDASPSPIPAGPGGFTMTPTTGTTVNFNGTLVQVRFLALGDPGADPTDYEVVVDVNAAPAAVVAFTAVVNTEIVSTISVAVVATDTVGVRVRPASGGARNPNWSRIIATVDNQDGSVWTFGQGIAAGTYCLESTI